MASFFSASGHAGQSRTESDREELDDRLALRYQDVTRTFDRGRFVAVSGVSLDVQPGEIHSVIGPNGAGKTTLIKMAATILTPSAGRVVVNGFDTVRAPRQARRSLGLVIGGELGFYPRATARQNLLFFADVAGVEGRDRDREVARVLDAVDLSDRAHSKVNSYSRGMTQRLHIARALLGSPRLLIMDEPTSGLDPDIAITIRLVVRDLAAAGHAVLLTSHTMSEIEDLSSRISIIGAGQLRMTGSIRDVIDHANLAVTSTMSLHAQEIGLLEDLADCEHVAHINKHAKAAMWQVTVFWRGAITTAQAQEHIAAACRRRGIEMPVDVVSRPPTLEEAYVSLAGELKR